MPLLRTPIALAAFFALSGAAQAQTRAAPQCEAAEELTETAPVRGSTAGTADRFHASCARSALSGDRVYQFRVPQRSRVSLRLAAEYDAALYVRRACAEEVTEVACNDDARDTRHSALDLTLDAGIWYVFVDGYDIDATGPFTLALSIESLAPRVDVQGEVLLGGRRDLAGTRVEALDRAGRVIGVGALDAHGRFAVRVPGQQLVRVRALIDRVEVSTEFFDASQRRAVTLGGASVRRAPAGAVPSA